jgi:hypothetical protein
MLPWTKTKREARREAKGVTGSKGKEALALKSFQSKEEQVRECIYREGSIPTNLSENNNLPVLYSPGKICNNT